jgi:hypothetical protein
MVEAAAAVRRCFALHDHIQFGVLPRFVEVDQRELSALVRNFGYLSEAASFAIGLRGGSNGFGFKLIRKRPAIALFRRHRPQVQVGGTSRLYRVVVPQTFSIHFRHWSRNEESERPFELRTDECRNDAVIAAACRRGIATA